MADVDEAEMKTTLNMKHKSLRGIRAILLRTPARTADPGENSESIPSQSQATH